MKSKLFTIYLLFAALMLLTGSCLDDGQAKDKVEKITLYVSENTGTTYPLFVDTPITCMLVKEKDESKWQPLTLGGIEGFTYEEGYAYTLSVQKTTLADPPADGSLFEYKLLKILSKEKK